MHSFKLAFNNSKHKITYAYLRKKLYSQNCDKLGNYTVEVDLSNVIFNYIFNPQDTLLIFILYNIFNNLHNMYITYYVLYIIITYIYIITYI